MLISLLMLSVVHVVRLCLMYIWATDIVVGIYNSFFLWKNFTCTRRVNSNWIYWDFCKKKSKTFMFQATFLHTANPVLLWLKKKSPSVTYIDMMLALLQKCPVSHILTLIWHRCWLPAVLQTKHWRILMWQPSELLACINPALLDEMEYTHNFIWLLFCFLLSTFFNLHK